MTQVFTGSRISPVDRIYARAISVAVRRRDEEAAIREFVTLAGGDPHSLGRARGMLEALLNERPEAEHLRYGLALLTTAWIRSIESST
ncbi:MAG TPA: hypothetical protein VM618_08975 [Acidimicrobiia bacterium]|nr:hypothetical protein [Acidimicrobiia bacterium]